MSFASFASGSNEVVDDVDRLLDGGVDHLRDKHEGDREHQRDQLEARDAVPDGGDQHRNRDGEVDAHVPVRPEDVDDPLDRVVEALDQGERAAGTVHAYIASRDFISSPWS